MVHARQLVAASEVAVSFLSLAARERNLDALYFWGGELGLRSNYRQWQHDPAFRLLLAQRALTCAERRPPPLASRWRLDVARLVELGEGIARRLAAELTKFPPVDPAVPVVGHRVVRLRREAFTALGAAAALGRLDRALGLSYQRVARQIASKLGGKP